MPYMWYKTLPPFFCHHGFFFMLTCCSESPPNGLCKLDFSISSLLTGYQQRLVSGFTNSTLIQLPAPYTGRICHIDPLCLVHDPSPPKNRSRVTCTTPSLSAGVCFCVSVWPSALHLLHPIRRPQS